MVILELFRFIMYRIIHCRAEDLDIWTHMRFNIINTNPIGNNIQHTFFTPSVAFKLLSSISDNLISLQFPHSPEPIHRNIRYR